MCVSLVLSAYFDNSDLFIECLGLQWRGRVGSALLNKLNVVLFYVWIQVSVHICLCACMFTHILVHLCCETSMWGTSAREMVLLLWGRGTYRTSYVLLFCVQMAIIFNEEHLCDMQTPCVAQQFVNHSAVLHKVSSLCSCCTVCSVVLVFTCLLPKCLMY